MGFKYCLYRATAIFFFLEITFTTGYRGIRSNSKTSPEFHLYPFYFSPLCGSNYFLLVIRFNHLNHTIITYPDTVLFCFVLFWSAFPVAGGPKMARR